MEKALSKSINDKNCSVKEGEESLQCCVDIYLKALQNQDFPFRSSSIQEEPLLKRSKATFETTKESNAGNWSNDEDDKIHIFHLNEEIISEFGCSASEI